MSTTRSIQNVIILGLGKVGTLVATLLHKDGYQVTGVDQRIRGKLNFKTSKGNIADPKFLKKVMKGHDAVISCLPHQLNKVVFDTAFGIGLHYFDLTEDVPSTEHMQKVAKNAKAVVAPQCGLAPGFISIVGADIAKQYKKIRSIELRVGALPQHPKGDLGYAFNWSPEGVVNEYLNDCKVIRNGNIQYVPGMQDLETIVIKGRVLEAFSTSGGLGTFCESYHGKVDELNYKTMRYPGHMKLMRFFFHELDMKDDRKRAGEILVNAKPPVSDDVVYVHAAVEGIKKSSIHQGLYRTEFVHDYYPQTIGGQEWRAISWTTACSIVATLELVATKKLPQQGFIKQEDIALDDFFNTSSGRYYGSKIPA